MDVVIQNVSAYVQQLFREHSKPELTYHNLTHTRNVVSRTNEMIQYYGLSSDESRIVQVAAWFHDVGYLISGMHEHERVSVEIMKQFLTASGIGRNEIQLIAGCIMCTRLPTNPGSLLEEILCDADTYHFGTDEFLKSDEAIKREFKLKKEIINDDWDKKTLQLLTEHRFYTSYCQQHLNAGKNANIQLLNDRIRQFRSNIE